MPVFGAFLLGCKKMTKACPHPTTTQKNKEKPQDSFLYASDPPFHVYPWVSSHFTTFARRDKEENGWGGRLFFTICI